jgi:hypothetical protein
MAIIVKTSKQLEPKKAPSVPLRLRIHPDNKRRYAQPTYSDQGKLKAFWCLVNGNKEHHAEGVYYLRVKGKKWSEQEPIQRWLGSNSSSTQPHFALTMSAWR